MDTQHKAELISDYVLNLLEPDARRQVEQHTLVCPECRLALSRERNLASLIREAIAAVPAPSPLPAPSPAPSFPGSPATGNRAWRWSLNHSLAPVAVVCLLFALGLMLSQFSGQFLPALAPAPTATSTQTPTATALAAEAQDTVALLVHLDAGNSDLLRITQTPDGYASARPADFIATNAPSATPVAAAQAQVTN